MSERRRTASLTGLRQAFDEVRFGAHTLNLRASLPTADQATTHAEQWLRQRQVEAVEEVLVITGRGNNSDAGVSRVREAVIRLLHDLKRRGVVAGHDEHTPGSFVVRLAPMRELLEAPRRKRTAKAPPPPADPQSLASLDPATRTLLRHLAERTLDALGVLDREPFMDGEMLRQFSTIAASVPAGPDREARLHAALRTALDHYE